MAELRFDPIQKRWVIIATERARRPSDFQLHEEYPTLAVCPFCEGNEDKTPPETYAIRKPGTQRNKPGWEVRVVPNKFPALRIEGNLERKGIGIFDLVNGIGAHEVIIETPNHTLNLADMPVADLEKVLLAYQERLQDLCQDGRFRYIQIFKNYGLSAGASLAHSHSQLIATPITPRTVAIELNAAKGHYTDKERCIYCDMINQEIDAGKRVVLADDQYVVLAPFASRFPFELFIAPRQHQHDFMLATSLQRQGLARVLREVLARLKVSLNDPPYNFVLHTAPNTQTIPPRPGYWITLEYDFHWHFEIMPRLTRLAGFEWGTGFYINPTPPEDVAGYLRELGAVAPP